jgi:hypothetical protein
MPALRPLRLRLFYIREIRFKTMDKRREAVTTSYMNPVIARPADAPPPIETGAFQAYFIYDVADVIDLTCLGSIAGGGTARAPLQLRREASPGFIEFPIPPVIARLPDSANGIGIRAKIFDYGVISVRLRIPFSGSWSAFAAFTKRLRSDDELPRLARTTLDALLADIAPALDEPHQPLAEEYFVFKIESFAAPVTSAQLLRDHAATLASLLLCEERTLTPGEQEEALRVSFSYFDDDLAVVQWDTAFVYDRREGAAAVADILEFANTQLLELRQHDALLDAELDTIYKLDDKNTSRSFGRKQAQQAADRVRFLIVDVLELTDRASNALKIIGDAYYARLYRGAAQRLGLRDWQQQIDSKLQSVGEMYRFFNDQAQTARSEFLEIIIILLIVLEIVIGLLALRH